MKLTNLFSFVSLWNLKEVLLSFGETQNEFGAGGALCTGVSDKRFGSSCDEQCRAWEALNRIRMILRTYICGFLDARQFTIYFLVTPQPILDMRWICARRDSLQGAPTCQRVVKEAITLPKAHIGLNTLDHT